MFVTLTLPIAAALAYVYYEAQRAEAARHKSADPARYPNSHIVVEGISQPSLAKRRAHTNRLAGDKRRVMRHLGKLSTANSEVGAPVIRQEQLEKMDPDVVHNWAYRKFELDQDVWDPNLPEPGLGASWRRREFAKPSPQRRRGARRLYRDGDKQQRGELQSALF